MKKSFIILVSAVMAMVGCAKQHSPVPAGQSGDVKFTSNIQTYTLKASDTAFDNGDEVGIFAGTPIGKDNVKGVVSGTSLNHNSAIKWVDGYNGIIKFYAYYPYVENATTNLPFAVQANQNANNGYTRSDLMLASAQSAQTENAVALNFNHAMSKVSIGITNNIPDATVSKVVFENVALEVLVNLETGALTPSDAIPGNITARSIPGGYELILVPQTASPKIRVSLSNGKDYVFEITSAFTFQAGKKASASLVLDPQAEANAVQFTMSVSNWDEDENPLNFDDPSIEDGEPTWEVVGTLNGRTWENPTVINMTKDEWGNWNADITYVAGEEFKLRCENVWAGINAEWNTEIYGLGDFGNDSNYLSTEPNSKNIKLFESGEYHLFYVASNNWFIVTKNGGDDPVEPTTTVTINVFNGAELNPINLYMWADGGVQLVGEWPGMGTNATDVVRNKHSYKSFVVENLPKNEYVGYIINDNNGKQTSDLTLPVITEDTQTIWLYLKANMEVEVISNPDTFEPSTAPAFAKLTLNVYNTSAWKTLMLYAWYTGGALTGEWPGIAPIPDNVLVNNVPYSKFVIDSYPTDVICNYILNDSTGGEGHQTADLEAPGKIYEDTTVYIWLKDDFTVSYIDNPLTFNGE